MDPLSPWSLGVSGFGFTVVFAVFMAILRGSLIPKRHHDEVIGEVRKYHQEAMTELLSRYTEMREDRDYWREGNTRIVSVAEKATGAVEKLADGGALDAPSP